jgi:hypothetical protein
MGLEPGISYWYTLTAVYRDRTGRERIAEPVVVPVNAQQKVTPIGSLRTELMPSDGESPPVVRISWRAAASDEVRIRHARTACPWPFGTSVAASDVISYGVEVRGERVVRDGRVELTGELPWGQIFLTPFVVNGDSAVVGQDVNLGLTTPISVVSFERHGPELFLSWAWPDRASAAEVRWNGPNGTGRRRVTRGERARDDGWLRIPVGDAPVAVDLRAVEIGPPEVISNPRVIHVAAADSELWYDIAWKPVLPGMTPRVCDVRVGAPDGLHQVTVVAVAKGGVARPANASDGEEVGRAKVTVSGDHPAVFQVNVPRDIRKPYWLCCFVVDNDHQVMIDPPIKQMKVG